MEIKRFIQRLNFYFCKNVICLTEFFWKEGYRNLYAKLLKYYGVKMDGRPLYIHRTAKFDDFDKITLGSNCVISFGVNFLTHDYSRLVGYNHANKKGISSDSSWDNPLIGSISIGENSFIGARSLLLPNTSIGSDCIIGAGSVVKGHIPDGTIVIGNPAKALGSIDDFTDKWINQHIHNNK